MNVNYIPNLEAIKLSGLVSKNYHSSILIFETCIENMKLGAYDDDTEDKKKNLKIKKKKLKMKKRKLKQKIILRKK